eukprot:TRINITY_DN10703_c0_g1_i1.p1 TRINITY_DN10703_c0_g1~~TRINITY_DN10703_c0_g1_i1.p1  ORF type:complete len:208 (-),score=38.97 TRINITY_DN10703_c0_g1_i1:47-577(-)
MELAELDEKYSLVVLLGEDSVGKSTLLNAVEGTHSYYPSTEEYGDAGDESSDKVVVIGDDPKRATKLWFKIPSEEEVDNFNLLQRIRAVVIMFDVTDRKTFDQIMKWHRVAASTYDSHAFLVANKLDLAESREISSQSAQLIADRYEMKYLELSAMTKKGVADLVAEITAAVNRDD